ncbi:hypothetical protein TWF281_006561 [Arthrobotrys megalospora]
MSCRPWFAVNFVAIFPLLAVAALPEIPRGADFAYEIDGDVIIDFQLEPKNITGWDHYPGTKYPEPCIPLTDSQTKMVYTFEHVRRLALKVDFYGVPLRDNAITFEFFQDKDCRVRNHPRMLYNSGEYPMLEDVITRIGGLRLIDPLALAFARRKPEYPFLSQVNPSENILLKTEERWDRDRRIIDEVGTDLSTGNLDRICTICQQSLIERQPSLTLVGDCGHAYHALCLERWKSSYPEYNRRDPLEFQQRTGFPLVQMTSCPDCRKPLNLRKMSKNPTRGTDRNQPSQIQPEIFGSPERRGNVDNDRSAMIGPPSLYTTPGSDLEDLVNPIYMDERIRGVSRIKRPADFDFQSSFVRHNPLVGPEIRLQPDPEANIDPVVLPTEYDYDPSVSEGIPNPNSISRSLLSGQLG